MHELISDKGRRLHKWTKITRIDTAYHTRIAVRERERVEGETQTQREDRQAMEEDGLPGKTVQQKILRYGNVHTS